MRVIHNRVEAVSGAVGARQSGAAAAIAGLEQEGSAEAHPVFVDRKFERSKLGVDIHAAPGDGIECVVAQRLVKDMAYVHTTDVTITRPSKVVSMNAVRLDPLVDNCADWR